MSIPRDIKKTANDFASQWYFPGWEKDELRDGVAALLMAERQRCAGVCDESAGSHRELSTDLKNCGDAESARLAANDARLASNLAKAILPTTTGKEAIA